MSYGSSSKKTPHRKSSSMLRFITPSHSGRPTAVTLVPPANYPVLRALQLPRSYSNNLVRRVDSALFLASCLCPVGTLSCTVSGVRQDVPCRMTHGRSDTLRRRRRYEENKNWTSMLIFFTVARNLSIATELFV